jgi:hypothetical protein
LLSCPDWQAIYRAGFLEQTAGLFIVLLIISKVLYVSIDLVKSLTFSYRKSIFVILCKLNPATIIHYAGGSDSLQEQVEFSKVISEEYV